MNKGRVAVCVGFGGRLRQATVFFFFLEFMASRVKIFSNDVDGFSTIERDQRGKTTQDLCVCSLKVNMWGGGSSRTPLTCHVHVN